MNKIKIFITNNKKLPNKNSNNSIEKKLGNWLNHQKQNYVQNKNNMKKSLELKEEFTNFINDYDIKI